MSPSEVSKARWLVAHEQEKMGIENAEDIEEWLRVRRHTWASLLDSLKGMVAFNGSTTVLDIGNGPTSIFLVLREGEKYAVDPNLDRLFELHPFIKEIEEYRDVNFVSKPIEEATFEKQFDLVFMINMLDHVGELKPFTDRVDELLAPSGTLVIVVDCYADRVVRSIMSFFDVDLPHPHHFLTEDIVGLFSGYELKKQDDQISSIFRDYTFRGKRSEIKIYRVDKFITRMRKILSNEGKQTDVLFILKYVLCYSFAFLVASLRRRERPIHPLKKLRLLVFQKHQTGG